MSIQTKDIQLLDTIVGLAHVIKHKFSYRVYKMNSFIIEE